MSKIADYFVAQRYVGRRSLMLMLGGMFVLIPAILAFGKGLLSPRAFATMMIAYAACIAVAVFVILRNARARLQASLEKFSGIPDDAMRRKFRKRIRNMKLGIAFFALVLVYGLWETRDTPLPPRLIGATVNLLYQTVMIQSIRRMQKQLKQEAGDQRQ
jgi:hypothetical protein